MTSEANVTTMLAVRPATAADADAIGRIQVESWRAAYSRLLPEETIAAFDVAARQQLWREGLARPPRPGSATFVAAVDDETVGFATVGASQSEDATGELYAIYVHPSSWGHGAGRALIERSEESLRASGFTKALLWVLDGNERAERFYRAAGWEHDGEKEDVFQGATVTELRYRKTL
ncbi:MAG TPA: GNAT family N-acetyltransferase [Gaiellaceae bacterium]|nr:GNAT family N-acetyltransferase [Gaiellaceae bacterium]